MWNGMTMKSQSNVTRERTNRMSIEVQDHVKTTRTDFEITFDLPTKAAVTAEMIFASSRRNCTSRMSKIMFGRIKNAWLNGESRVEFTVFFNDRGWSTRIVNALTDYDPDDSDRQDDVDELIELIEKAQ